ncbi:Uncharacterised protein [Enterobacter cloacae]|nr:Uncharacterised protein [Enterobacter cloacae]
MPSTIGVLRAIFSEPVRRISQSEMTPPSTPPTKPQMAGTEATNPAFRIDIPRACTR